MLISLAIMSSAPTSQQIRDVDRLPEISLGILIGIVLFGFFIVGYDQGHLFSIAQGESAFEELWMHEFYHDMRHAAGFPCH
jgi:uncharacterized membrane protein SpoIIM required for sporulation